MSTGTRDGTLIARKMIVGDSKAHPQVASGAGAPSTTPRAIGDLYVDTAAVQMWVAVWDTEAASMVWSLANANAYTWRVESGASYNATAADGTIGMSFTGTKSVTLPKISSLGVLTNQKCFTVVDRSGTAETFPLNVFAASGDHILEDYYFPINSNYGSIKLFCVGGDTWLIGSPSA